MLSDTVYIVFDGDCPLCSRLATVYQLRQAGVNLRFINARDGGDLVQRCRREALDLNEGIVVFHRDEVKHGEAAFSYLAGLSRSRFHRAVALLPSAVRVLIYWSMKSFRRILLQLLGIKPL